MTTDQIQATLNPTCQNLLASFLCVFDTFTFQTFTHLSFSHCITTAKLSKAKQSNQIMKCTDKKNSGKRYILSENDSQQKKHLNSNTLLRVIYQKKVIYTGPGKMVLRHRIRLKN